MAALYFLFCVSILIVTSALDSLKPLNQYPFLMSHDSVSGEIIDSRDHVVSDWTKTQSVGLIPQLNCGARAFDYRPQLAKNGVVYGHHGGITIYKPMEESIQEILAWSTANSSDLVILYISHLDGDNCKNAVGTLLSKYDVYTVNDCSLVSSLTYQDAMNLASSNGTKSTKLFAIYDCTNENFDQDINCYSKDFACYDAWPATNNSQIPFNNLEKNLVMVTGIDPAIGYQSSMWMAQAHWQSTAASVVLGTLHNSSIVQDEMRAKVNSWLTQNVLNKQYKYINFLEVDEVCDGGMALYRALKSVY